MGKKIFEPIKINGMKLKNRIGFAPMLNMPRDMDFGPNEKTAEWLEARARGGAGLIMTGTVLPFHLMIPNGPERFTLLVEAVNRHGAKLGVQIGGGGPMMGTGPSALPYPNEDDPKISMFEYFTGSISPMPGVKNVSALSINDIEATVGSFAVAAQKLKEAGVDCIELHCAHGGATLFCSFISPFYNRREDDYGGSWEKRLRFPTDTIRKMREAVGPDYPLLVRINADDMLGGGGITLEDTAKFIVPAFEEAGVDCIDVSQGSILHSPEGITIPLYYPRGCYIHNAAAVKKITKLPVIGVGRIVDMDMAEQFLQEEKADIIYLGRLLTSDPEAPDKYFHGRADDIRKCIACNEGCGSPCAINYDIGPETVPIMAARKDLLRLPKKIPLTRADTPRKILVIGGGVAGMEAARVCALRGHDVTLFEKSNSIGGVVAALAMNPFTAEFQNVVDYLIVQLKKLEVGLRVGIEAGPAEVEGLKPDEIILATGASMTIPGVARGKPGVMDIIEALKNGDRVGDRVVVWGLMYGAEYAIALAKEGKQVTLIGGAGEGALARHTVLSRRWWVHRKLVDINVVRTSPEAERLTNPEVFYHIRVENVTDEGVVIVDKEGNETVLPYDTLVVSRGRKRNDSLFETLKGKASKIHKIGDCATAGSILKAIWAANDVARRI